MQLSKHALRTVSTRAAAGRNEVRDRFAESNETTLKKAQYDKEGFDPKAQKAVVATRTRAVARSFEFDADDAAFLLARFWAPEAAGAAES